MSGVGAKSMALSISSRDLGGTVSLRRRVTAFVLAAIANALLLFVLFTLAPAPGPRAGRETALTAVTLLPEASDPAKESAEPRREATAPPARPKPRPDRPAPAPVVPVPPPPLNMIVLSRDTYAASDISRLPAAAAPPADASSSGNHSGDTKRAAGQGPNGEELYAAEWYREPTDAELGGYLTASSPRTGWALIACRTASGYRVEDCAELGQSPPGSGLARAIRQAAWQFRVRPPRIGGKAMVGAWVSIRIDFSERSPG